jgi:hypothetical protein
VEVPLGNKFSIPRRGEAPTILPVRNFKDDIYAPYPFGAPVAPAGGSTTLVVKGGNIPRLNGAGRTVAPANTQYQLTEALGPDGYLTTKLRARKAEVDSRRGRPGAEVELYSYDVLNSDDRPGWPDHMYVVISDSNTGERWIARGGPSEKNMWPFFAKGAQRKLYIEGEVKPYAQSYDTKMIRDRNKAIRYETSTYVDGVRGRDLINKAGTYVDNLNRLKLNYGAEANSNSVAHDVYNILTGKDYSRDELWGSETELPRRVATSQKQCRDLRPASRGGTCR